MTIQKKRIRVEIKSGECFCGKAISRRATTCMEHRDIDKFKHSNWKGDEVGYYALHRWVIKEKGQPSLCEHCGTTKAKKFEWANISGEYKRELSDWMRLCTKCHHLHDDNTNKGWVTRRKNI